MEKLKIWNDSASDAQIRDIAQALQDGQIIIWPTDTLYAIAGDALNPKSVEKICRLKGINPDKTNLSIICADISQAAQYARFDNKVFSLLRHAVPGPYTFLCRAASSLPRVFKGRKVVGIRIPDSEICRRVAEALGHPVMTTSVEFSDDDYAINPELIAENYEGRVDMLIDGGDGGTEPSTIVDCTGSDPEIVREGKGILEL